MAAFTSSRTYRESLYRPWTRSSKRSQDLNHNKPREVFVVSESPYIRWVKNKQPEPDKNYVHDLVVLRAMVRQEDRQGDAGWGGTWSKERYQKLRAKHPEALMAFEAELRWEREEEQRQRETLEKHRYSPYIAEVEQWPDSEGKDKYLRDLKRLRDELDEAQMNGSHPRAFGHRK
jgi:hypothetical protein